MTDDLSARLRVAAYLERRKKSAQTAYGDIHSYDVGCDGEVVLLASDLEALLDNSALTQSRAETAAAYERAAEAIMTECHDDMDRSEEADIIRALATPDQTAALDKLIAEAVKPYVEALAWYGEQSRLARLIHSEGDTGRNALQADGGKRAKAILAAIKGAKA